MKKNAPVKSGGGGCDRLCYETLNGQSLKSIVVGPKVQVRIHNALLLIPSAEQEDFSVLHKGEFRASNHTRYQGEELVAVQAELFGGGIEGVHERGLGIRHIVVRLDGENPVVGEIDVPNLEGVAVLGLVRAVGGESEMDDAGVLSSDLLQFGVELFEVHTSPIEAVRGHEADAVGVGVVRQSEGGF